MSKIKCETCDVVIAEHNDPAEAEELAFEAEAYEEREASIWVCCSCYEAEISKWYSEINILVAEASVRAYEDDAHENGAMAAYLRAKGEL